MKLFVMLALAAITNGLKIEEAEAADAPQQLDDETMAQVLCQGEECDDAALVEERYSARQRAINALSAKLDAEICALTGKKCH